MQDNIASLVSALFCLIPVGFMGIMILGFVALFVWIVNRTTRPKTVDELAADKKELQADVEKLMPKIRPWQPEGLADLSTDWDARWRKFAQIKAHDGTIPGVKDPEGPPWVAFTFKVRGTSRPDGQMHARTTAQRFDYRITPQGVEISVDDKPLGQMQPDGALLDATGYPIGHARRPKGTPFSLKTGNIVPDIIDRRERSYAVELHGRTVAWLANPPVQQPNVISIKKQKPKQYPPALTLAETPSEEEADWLLALAILQVAFYNVLETIWMIRNNNMD